MLLLKPRLLRSFCKPRCWPAHATDLPKSAQLHPHPVGHCTVFTEVGPTTVAARSVAGFALPALGATSSKGRSAGINRGSKSTVAYNT